ncbi:MAG: DUF4062 domain-containing protein [Anaerolineales bacterium]
MSEKIDRIRLFVASPGDVPNERTQVDKVVREINATIGNSLKIVIEVLKWEDVYPDLGRPQTVINGQIGEYDIFVGIMWKRFGTPTGEAESGTAEEFERAYEIWKQDKLIHVLFYFSQKPYSLHALEEARQVQKVLEFRENISKIALVKQYKNTEDFSEQFRKNLTKLVNDIVASPKRAEQIESNVRKHQGSKQLHPVDNISPEMNSQLLINPAKNLFSSFQPSREGNKFVQLHIPTTPGIVNEVKRASSIYIIKDPIRPCMIQIGETRSLRKVGNPDAIPELTNLNLAMLKQMYPFILGQENKWVRMVFAELTTDPDILDFINEKDPEDDVKRMAAQNPSGSNALRQKDCKFCDQGFIFRRKVNSSTTTTIIPNDFPYGPYFHYIAMPVDAVHSWEDLSEEQLRDLNQTIHDFLISDDADNLKKSKGVFIGFNSTIRHLVMAKRTRSSAGASISHVHKQIWGMTPDSFNLADHLSEICEEYQKKGIDYLDEYLKTLAEKGFILWQDEYVALYVPLGQTSLHELQLMVKRAGVHHFLQLTEPEITSMSKAEFITVQLFKRLGINSFNEILMAESFNATTPCFRLIMAFITREVDLAVSELNQLYVVDKHPSDTVLAINEQWQYIHEQYGFVKDERFAQPG